MPIICKNALLDFVTPLLSADPVIVEAGAYNGRDTKKLARYWPKGVVHAFEPVPEIFALLQQSVAQEANVVCHPYALSSVVGEAIFYVSQKTENPDQPFQAGSLHKPTGRLAWSPVIYPSTIIVPTITLDAWTQTMNITYVDFLWLDVQGHALAIMQACPIIMKTVKILYLEIEFKQAYEGQSSFDEVIQWLAENQFVEIGRDFDNQEHWFYGNMIFKNNQSL
jgi:FkbM family methyltransferase